MSKYSHLPKHIRPGMIVHLKTHVFEKNDKDHPKTAYGLTDTDILTKILKAEIYYRGMPSKNDRSEMKLSASDHDNIFVVSKISDNGTVKLNFKTAVRREHLRVFLKEILTPEEWHEQRGHYLAKNLGL